MSKLMCKKKFTILHSEIVYLNLCLLSSKENPIIHINTYIVQGQFPMVKLVFIHIMHLCQTLSQPMRFWYLLLR